MSFKWTKLFLFRIEIKKNSKRLSERFLCSLNWKWIRFGWTRILFRKMIKCSNFEKHLWSYYLISRISTKMKRDPPTHCACGNINENYSITPTSSWCFASKLRWKKNSKIWNIKNPPALKSEFEKNAWADSKIFNNIDIQIFRSSKILRFSE